MTSLIHPFTPRVKIAAVVAVVIAFLVYGYCQRRQGARDGQLEQKIVAAAVVVEARRSDAAVETKKSVTKRAEYNAARAKIVFKGDTVIADGQRVLMPSVVDGFEKADALSAQDSTSLAKQNLLVGALDVHAHLLQEEKRPWCGRKCGVAIGIAGTTAVVVIAVKIIKAARK